MWPAILHCSFRRENPSNKDAICPMRCIGKRAIKVAIREEIAKVPDPLVQRGFAGSDDTKSWSPYNAAAVRLNLPIGARRGHSVGFFTRFLFVFSIFFFKSVHFHQHASSP